jgi:hypothetical protein
VGPHEPPEVVSVNVTDATDDAEALYVVVLGVVPPLLVNVPPAPPSDHTAAVAPPPKEPPNAAVVAFWQMAVTDPPAFTVGFGFTVNDLFADVVPHEPPLVVSVSVTGVPDDAEAVYVVVDGVEPELFVNEPPAPPSDHTAAVAPPPNEPPKAAVVPPWQMAETPLPAFAVGLGCTVNDLFADVVPHEPPLVVSVRVTGVPEEAEAVYVVVDGVDPVLFVNDPPAPPSDHTAAVALPPNEPPKAAVVPPWQMAETPLPAFTVGFDFTDNDLFAEVVPHDPPLVVSVSVTGVPDEADAVYVVVDGVDPPLLVNEPPAPPSDHTAAVAPPPNEPPNAAVVPPWQMAETPLPAFTVGFGFTVNDLFADVVPHDPPLVVSVSVTGELDDAEAVYVVVDGVDPVLLVNDPPAPPSDQTAAVALPPNEPPKAAVVPPWQMAVTDPPALTVGKMFIVKELEVSL